MDTTVEAVLKWAMSAHVYVKCPSCPPGRVFGGNAPYVFKPAVVLTPEHDYSDIEARSFFDITVRAVRTDSGHFGDNHLTTQEAGWIEAKANDDLRMELLKLLRRIQVQEQECRNPSTILISPQLESSTPRSRTAMPSGSLALGSGAPAGATIPTPCPSSRRPRTTTT